MREHELKVDMKGFQAAMDQQRSSARAASNFGIVEKLNIDPSLTTDFTGYDSLDGEGRIIAVSYTHLTLPTKRIV